MIIAFSETKVRLSKRELLSINFLLPKRPQREQGICSKIYLIRPFDKPDKESSFSLGFPKA